MALNLDTRQRAMLQEMGITVWQPDPQASAAPEIRAERPAAAVARAPQAAASEFARAAPTAALPAVRPAPRPAPVPTPPAPASDATAAAGWRLHPARPVYGPSDVPPATDDGGWLILLEHPTGHGLSATTGGPDATGTVLEGDAARLLDNMLRALRLHRHPRVWSAGLERETAQGPSAASDCLPLDTGLQAMVQALQPARILVLGLAAARAVLGRSDALGRLRADTHQAAGLPVVVTYDPSYLLRAPHAKPAAWADLCHAQFLAPQPGAR